NEAKGGEQKITEKHGGKFSLLGRECKAEEEGGVETTPGSPPLDVDDTGTPGCNGWEVNIVGSGQLGKSRSFQTPFFHSNYGIPYNITIQAAAPYQFNTAEGTTRSGLGLAEFGVKYRFYEDESRDLSVAVYPQLEFAIPGTSIADSDEGKGTLTKLPVLMSTKIGETSKGDVMLTANLGYNISTQPGTENYVSAALGVGFPLMNKLAVMLEGSTEQALTKNMANVREGVLKANLAL